MDSILLIRSFDLFSSFVVMAILYTHRFVDRSIRHTNCTIVAFRRFIQSRYIVGRFAMFPCCMISLEVLLGCPRQTISFHSKTKMGMSFRLIDCF